LTEQDGGGEVDVVIHAQKQHIVARPLIRFAVDDTGIFLGQRTTVEI